MSKETELQIRVFVILAGLFFILINIYAMYKELKLAKKIEEKVKPKEVYVKWDECSNFVLAFVSTHFNRSDKRLIHVLADTLGRSESSILRKMSRLKGHVTGKGSNVTHMEADLMDTLESTTVANPKYSQMFYGSLNELGLKTIEIQVIYQVMRELKTN